MVNREIMTLRIKKNHKSHLIITKQKEDAFIIPSFEFQHWKIWHDEDEKERWGTAIMITVFWLWRYRYEFRINHK